MTTAPDFTRNFFRVPRGVFRELIESGDLVALGVYLVCLERVAYVAGPRSTRAHGIVDLEVGELVLGSNELADLLGTNRSAIRTAIERLEKRQLIAKRSTNLGSFIRVLGYTAKPDGPAIEPPSSQPESANQQPTFRPTSRPADRHYQDPISETQNGNTHRACAPLSSEASEESREAASDRETAISRVIAHHSDLFERAYQKRPRETKPQRAKVAALLDVYSESELYEFIRNMFDSTWVTKATKTLTFFSEHIDNFVVLDERSADARHYREQVGRKMVSTGYFGEWQPADEGAAK